MEQAAFLHRGSFMKAIRALLTCILALATGLVAQVNLGGTTVARDHIIVYLFIGHSNLCSSGPDPYTTIQPRTWNYRIDDGNPRWVHAQDPVHDAYCWGGSRGGPATQFLKAMQDAYPGYHFGVLQNADKAASVSRTSSCSGQRYGAGGSLTNELLQAAGQIKDKVTFGGMFVNLGVMEREWSGDREQFADSIVAMVNQIRTTLGLPNLPLLMQQYEMGATGSFSPSSTGAQEIIRQINAIPGKTAHAAVVSTSWSTQSGMMHDDHHFSKAGHDRLATEIRNTIQNKGLDFWAGPLDTQAPTAPASLTGHAMGTTVTLTWSPSTDNSGAILQYIAYSGATEMARFSGSVTTGDVTGLAAHTTYTFTVRASDGAGNVSAASNAVSVTTGDNPLAPLPLYINCGGAAGGKWRSDQQWDGVWGYSIRQNAVTVSNAIAGTVEDQMYNSVAHQAFTYRVALQPGTYRVTLHFCEHWRSVAGERVFSMAVNGQPASPNPIDILAQVDKFTAFDLVEQVGLDGGELTVSASGGIVGDPILSGISVEAGEALPVAIPVITPAGGEVPLDTTRIVLSTSTSGATVYYTTDGSSPDTSSARVASGGSFLLYLDFGQSKTVTARAGKGGMPSSAVTSATFTRPQPSSPVVLRSPNGDRDYTVGDTMHITWDGDPALLPLATVEITFDGGEAWLSVTQESIAPDEPSYGNVAWIVPAQLASVSTVSTDVLVRVRNYEPTALSTDVSDSAFSILSSATASVGVSVGVSSAPLSIAQCGSHVRMVAHAHTPHAISVFRLDGSAVARFTGRGAQVHVLDKRTAGAAVLLVRYTNNEGIRRCHTLRIW
jgi:hypothetical protein